MFLMPKVSTIRPVSGVEIPEKTTFKAAISKTALLG